MSSDREPASTWQVKAVQGERSRSPERTALVHPARTCALALLSLFVGKGLALNAKAHGSPCSSTRRGDSSCCELRSSLRGSVVAPVPYRVGLALRPGTTKNSARRRLCSCCSVLGKDSSSQASQVEELCNFHGKKMKILPIFKTSLRLPSPQEFRCLNCLVTLLFVSTPSGSENIPRALRAWQRRLLRLLSYIRLRKVNAHDHSR